MFSFYQYQLPEGVIPGRACPERQETQAGRPGRALVLPEAWQPGEWQSRMCSVLQKAWPHMRTSGPRAGVIYRLGSTCLRPPRYRYHRYYVWTWSFRERKPEAEPMQDDEPGDPSKPGICREIFFGFPPVIPLFKQFVLILLWPVLPIWCPGYRAYSPCWDVEIGWFLSLKPEIHPGALQGPSNLIPFWVP